MLEKNIKFYRNPMFATNICSYKYLESNISNNLKKTVIKSAKNMYDNIDSKDTILKN